ncbi:putative sister chromatid cohesion protein Ctf8 [Myriangium duriaei CBS 260.36]|uniref:Sister chromatid cohesion protein Ctf8 n=1 Tax=Myriangium duriaei CBS 260.36 TaxID=1168546 RepID=A0A9P4MIF7_9PEZI|nr:putative sister chromatid cohesion protein Ctf8 [Myriangium duriaei CBS 260.36]
MPSIPLHPPPPKNRTSAPNPLPGLLQTPSGLAILELQGTIHFPSTSDHSDGDPPAKRTKVSTTEVGKLVFPLYNSSAPADDKAWMKRVYLYVGRNQRMTGEVKALGKPLAVIRRRKESEAEGEALEIVEVVRWKVVFASRPEPVGTMEGVEEG